MEASFVDLRNKSAEVIRALSRNERVTVLYRGKPAAVMLPLEARADDALVSAKDHPAFGRCGENFWTQQGSSLELAHETL